MTPIYVGSSSPTPGSVSNTVRSSTTRSPTAAATWCSRAPCGRAGRSVWVGDVLIRANAVGTQTYEINRNLLLDDGPRADSVPNLEILTGDVAGAGHASATGRFDEEQVFYLRSRGISEEEARRLVVLGFFADVLDGIDVPMIRAEVMRAVEAELGYRREVQ